jgi:3-methyl-2-oxobutanoate hydroxymethyltransferase
VVKKTIQEKIEALRDGPISALTAYDYPTARLLDECGVDLILVGDSLGMVFAGCEDTTSVTMDQMLYHTEVVARGVENSFLVSDLPWHSYETPDQAVANARRLVAAGAQGVKLEGGVRMIDQVRAIIEEGIAFVGHVGMLPQSVREEKGYKKWGKSEPEVQQLLADAKALSDAGAAAIVLESIVPEIATEITKSVEAPTIGIGAGTGCDGQIAVIHDVIGFFPWFCPPFARPKADFAAQLREAVGGFIGDVKSSGE